MSTATRTERFYEIRDTIRVAERHRALISHKIAMVRYPVVLEADETGTITVTFPDFPGTQFLADDDADAMDRAPGALASIVDRYMRSRRPLPPPSPGFRHWVKLPPLMSTRVRLYRAMRT